MPQITPTLDAASDAAASAQPPAQPLSCTPTPSPAVCRHNTYLALFLAAGIDIFTVLLDRIDPHLLTNKFIAGDDFSIADITGHFMMNISKILKIEIKNNYPNVYRWQLSLENRDSVKIK